jgi:phage-related protein
MLIPPLPLPCKLLINKQPALSFFVTASEITKVDLQVVELKPNSSKRRYALVWKSLETVTEKTKVENFLRTIGTWSSFLLTEKSSENEEIKVICTEAYNVSTTGSLFEVSVNVQEVLR